MFNLFMGALTLKQFSNSIREWELSEGEGIDPTDSFGVDLRLSIRENQIFLAETCNANTPWLTDRGLLFFDGLFDENLYPAYMEDVDYYIKVKNENIEVSFLNVDYNHGEKDYSTSGSQTWRVDESLKEKIDKGRMLNDIEYMVKKWGDNYHSLNAYSKPFNNDNYDSKYTIYDLEFVRKKHLGF